MKALVLETYHKLIYKTVPDPVLLDDDVLISVKACGICGSDVHGLDGSTGRRVPPLIMGHEAAGEIIQTGKKVNGWRAGDRVTFDSTIYRPDDWYTRNGLYNLSDGRMVFGVSPGDYKRDGAFAEYLTVPQHLLYRIPAGVSYTQAALVEPAAVALHAVNITPVSKNDNAVVVGAGLIGLFIIQLLRLSGCAGIIAVDIDEDRLTRAAKLGADTVMQASESTAEEIINGLQGRGADIAFDAVGKADALHTAINSIRRGGTVTLVGNLSPVVDIPLQKIVSGQIRLQGSCAICGEYPDILNLINQKKLDVNAVLSKEAPLSEGAEWFEKLYRREKGLLKVVLIP
jgi:L-iditol 2-dehydrogenase